MTESENSKRNRQVKQDRSNDSNFYHIEIRSPAEFKRFRLVGINEKIGIEKVNGQREDCSWEIVKWLVSKDAAHIEDGKLIADHKKVQEIFDKINSVPIHIEGDRFVAKIVSI
ncbi:MAG: hypothetical protein M3405_08820 [Acidobacteriota bacterium]|jgi:hypothetical protein|nr:hypothetical protein [Acidobacteriota bacterium]